MRTNTKYSFRDATAIILQLVISKISIWYFKNINSKRITLIRKQGIGDAIFCTGVLKEFKKKYPKSKVKLVSNHPAVFDYPSVSSFSLTDFPFVWMTYGHYDFSVFRKTDKHITQIIAELIGLEATHPLKNFINIKDLDFQEFISNHIANEKYIVIHPWAGNWNTKRNWVKKKWEELTQMLLAAGYLVYQIGGKGDPQINGTTPFMGSISLHESFMLIKYAKLFIGVNSFAEQAAGAFGVNSIILYGPTNPIYSLNFNQVAITGSGIVEYNRLSDLKYEFDSVANIDCTLIYQQVITFVQDGKA